MFYRRIGEQNGVSIAHGTASAARPLTRRDGLGFSLSVVTAPAGATHELWYQNHWEANYVMEGRLRLEQVATGRSWEIEAGDLYCVGPKDRHTLTSHTPYRVMSAFNPPIEGNETHDAEGGYPPTGPLPEGQAEMFVRRPADLEAMGRAKVTPSGARLRRYLLAQDRLGVTWSDVHFADGSASKLWYKNHWEANYVFEGDGTLEHHGTGEVLQLEPGMLYCVGPDDPHTLTAGTGLHIVSLFNPPLTGTEVHDADGAYPPTGPLPPGPGKA
ncbi:MAG: ectoine synthase [Proteobacteria bacterium]|nr:ectoine synthase [Pseudomonadota bacterium]